MTKRPKYRKGHTNQYLRQVIRAAVMLRDMGFAQWRPFQVLELVGPDDEPIAPVPHGSIHGLLTKYLDGVAVEKLGTRNHLYRTKPGDITQLIAAAKCASKPEPKDISEDTVLTLLGQLEARVMDLEMRVQDVERQQHTLPFPGGH